MAGIVAGRDGLEALSRRVRRRRGPERVLRLAAYLPPGDRVLVEAVYRDGRSLADLARLADRPPAALARRLASVLRRLRSPLFAFVAIRGEALPSDTRAVARRRFIEGRTLTETCRLTHQPLHRVRQHLHTVESLAQFLKAGPG